MKRYSDADHQIQTTANALGWAYFPLLHIDRRYWHKTSYYFKNEGTEQGAAANPYPLRS